MWPLASSAILANRPDRWKNRTPPPRRFRAAPASGRGLTTGSAKTIAQGRRGFDVGRERHPVHPVAPADSVAVAVARQRKRDKVGDRLGNPMACECSSRTEAANAARPAMITKARKERPANPNPGAGLVSSAI